MSNYLEASNTSNNTLLAKLDYDDYDGQTYHINVNVKTTDTSVRDLYTTKKTQLEADAYKNDPHKDSGVPIYMPETKTFAPQTITEVDFKVESVIYYKHKVKTYAQFVNFGEDEEVVVENCGCTTDSSGNLHTDSSGNEVTESEYNNVEQQPFHSGLTKSYFEPQPYFLVPHNGIYAKKLILMNSIGLMDSSYRGNLKGYFFNTSSSNITLNKGEKILNIALPNLSRNYRLNVFEEADDIQDHPIREQEKQLEYYPQTIEEMY